MNIKIYQINTDRDPDRLKFMSWEEMQQERSGKGIDATCYDEVFSGDVDCNNPEEVFVRFNTEGHPLHRGHSLPVSDVVAMGGKTYYCQPMGFKEIPFDASQTQKPDDLMTVVYVEPHRAPFVTEIGPTLEAEQKAVGGLIEPIYNDDGTCLVGNEEAKLIGMEGNRRIGDGSSIMAGPFFVIGLTEDDFRSLTPEEVDKYMDRFADIEDISQEETEADTGFRFYFGI